MQLILAIDLAHFARLALTHGGQVRSRIVARRGESAVVLELVGSPVQLAYGPTYGPALQTAFEIRIARAKAIEVALQDPMVLLAVASEQLDEDDVIAMGK